MNSIIQACGKHVRVQGILLHTARIEGEKYVALKDPESLVAALRKSRTRVDLFTFMQRLPDTKPNYAYPMEWDNWAALPVSSYDHWLKHQIRFAPRGRVRQAEKKGVVTREVPFDDALVRGIWQVYNESAVRQGTRNTHFGKDPETVRNVEATFLDLSAFIGAFLGERMIGFVKLTWDDTRTAAHLVNIVSMVSEREKCPTNALVAESVRFCAERGMRYLVYQQFAYGNKAPDGLQRFKEINGFQKLDLPRYYVPITPVGWAALRLGLHHRFTERIPEPVAARLRGLRRAWYNRKLRDAMGQL